MYLASLIGAKSVVKGVPVDIQLQTALQKIISQNKIKILQQFRKP